MSSLQSTRRRVAGLVGGVLTATLLLSGCSTPASENASDGEAASRLPAAEGSTTYPLVLESPWGETTLEERPERISLVGPGAEIELLADLGVTPTGAADSAGDPDATVYPWALDLLDAPVEKTWTWSYDDPAPAESVAASEPDLIIADNTTTEEIYAKLSAIAPVLYVGDIDDWKEQIVEIADALDLSDAAEEAIADDEEYWTAFREEHPGFQGRTVTYFVVFGGEYGSFVGNTPDSAAERNFANWGFAPNPALAGFDGDQDISNELVSLLDADLLVGLASGAEAYAELVALPLFQQLPAVQDGRFLTIEVDSYADGEISVAGTKVDFVGHIGQALNGYTGPLGARYAAEALAPLFEKALQ